METNGYKDTKFQTNNLLLDSNRLQSSMTLKSNRHEFELYIIQIGGRKVKRYMLGSNCLVVELSIIINRTRSNYHGVK